jgi:hypothetical protein
MKMFGLAAIAAVAAMAFIGASSASANGPTALCKVATEPCPAGSLIANVHLINTAGTVGILLGNGPELTILCLTILGQGTVGALGNPQIITTTALTFTNCGTNAAHNNCTITTTELPQLNLLRTGAGVGTVTSVNGLTRVKCTIIFEIDCTYTGAGLKFGVKSSGGTNGKGMLNAEGTPLENTAGSFLCPETSEITTGLLEPLENTFIST